MKPQKIITLTLSTFLLACNQYALKKESLEPTISEGEIVSEKVIYGDDGRMEPLRAPASVQKLVKSTVALVKKEQLNAISSGGFRLEGKSFQQSHNLCPGERFAEQPTSAFCSGSLIGKNLVLTAGHCIQSEMDCQNTRFIFDYMVSAKGSVASSFGKSKIYACKRILKTVLENNGRDYAIIELDRNVRGRTPISLSIDTQAQISEEIFVIGHPVGLPSKVTLGGVVRSSHQDFFVTNLDTYGGNSGSPVFSAKTLKQVGVLVRGEQDFRYVNGCYRSNTCQNDSCRGEDVTHASAVIL